jgi:capsular exopolysaccharide synthesis family protein
VAIENAQTLRASLVSPTTGGSAKVVMITSSRSGEGKSALSLLLAYAEAAVGRSVIVIDADLRLPSLHQAFPPAEAGDVLSVLEGSVSISDALVTDPMTGVAALVTRRSVPYATRVIASAAFQRLIAELRQRYDTVIVDAPPVMLVADALIMGKYADATVYAVRWNSTPGDMVALGVEKLEQHGVNIAGVALTFVDFRRAMQFDQSQYGPYATSNPYFST